MGTAGPAGREAQQGRGRGPRLSAVLAVAALATVAAATGQTPARSTGSETGVNSLATLAPAPKISDAPSPTPAPADDVPPEDDEGVESPITPTPSPVPSTPAPVSAQVEGRAFERPTRMPTPDPTPSVDLNGLLDQLALAIDPDGTGTAAITVAWGDRQASVNGDRAVDSASSAKAYWAAAALAAGADPAVLEPDALAVFERSDNPAAGRLIDAAGGVDAVNAFTATAGLEATWLSAWSYGVDRQASDRAERGLDNLTSTDDLVRFAGALVAGDLLDDQHRRLLLDWMTATPDDLASSNGLDGMFTDRLPVFVAAATAHKAGWLRPGCCTRIEHVVVAVGIVPLGSGEPLLVAVAAQDSPDFDEAVAWLSEAVCHIWSEIEGQAVACAP